MWPRLKSEDRLIAFCLDDDIFAVVRSDWNIVVRNVRDFEQFRIEYLAHLAHFSVECRDTVANFAHGSDLLLAFIGVLCRTYLFRHRVTRRL